VRAERRCLPDCLGAVTRFADHHHIRPRRQQGANALAHNGVVITNQYVNGSTHLTSAYFSGTCTMTFAPFPTALSTFKLPPIFCVRSCIPPNPRPPRRRFCGSKPTPSSEISRQAERSEACNCTCTFWAW